MRDGNERMSGLRAGEGNPRRLGGCPRRLGGLISDWGFASLSPSHPAALVVAAILILARPAIADEITLKGSARLSRGATAVHLGDIAELSGPSAERHAGLVIASASDITDVMEITIREVRQRLTDAGVHWGKVQLNGRVVIVRAANPHASAPPLAMTPISLQKRKASSPPPPRAAAVEAAVELIDLATLRGAVTRTIVRGLGVDPERLRLVFDERDADFLDTSEATFRFEIEPLSAIASDRVGLSIRAWSGGRVEHTQTLTIRPLIKTDVAVARRDIDRGHQFRQEDLSVEARWLSVTQSRAASNLVHAVGRVTVTTVKAGEALRRRQLRSQDVIKRGDRVMVRCLVGGVVISLEAEARSGGAEGDRVELRKLGERTTFFGIATGPGAAVMDLKRPTTYHKKDLRP